VKREEQSAIVQAISITAGGFCLHLNANHEELNMGGLAGGVDIQWRPPSQLAGQGTGQALQPQVGESN
jgi:hypothetical protein